MRAYISRPLGTKDGIDFDSVNSVLIMPALARAGIEPEIVEFPSGNIQAEILSQIATADLLVADVSRVTSNVDFELGFRYAMRDRYTVLIKASTPDRLPFHLHQLRAVWYDPDNPSSSLEQLVTLIEQTIRRGRVDSPVYLALPYLQMPSLPGVQKPPQSFLDEVERASGAADAGYLKLLALESEAAPWRVEGQRLIGKKQFAIRDYSGAQVCLEAVRSSDPGNVEVNALLGTIYNRLGQFDREREALSRVLESQSASQTDRAEALALTARTIKTEWTDSWRQAAAEERGPRALVSPLLRSSRDAYLRAYKEYLNHYYSGINALSLTQVMLQLAGKHEQSWNDLFDDDDEAATALKSEEQTAAMLTGALDLALSAASETAARKGVSDAWIEISRADLTFLTGKKAQRIARVYDSALSTAPPFARDSVRRQLTLYADLGVFTDAVEQVLERLGRADDGREAALSEPSISRVLVFSGHMIDAPERPRPRFPAEREEVARRAIEQAVAAELAASEGRAMGIGGASSGGDILFHEVCRQLGIRSEFYLPIPEDEYVSRYLAPVGGNWLARFKSLRASAQVRVLQASVELPEWLRGRPAYSYWQRSNLWVLNSALSHPGAAVTLIALWNGEPGEGTGGTADMIQQARASGSKCVVLNSTEIFGLR
jgi:tetratricopeptide (TPR) repeat protein